MDPFVHTAIATGIIAGSYYLGRYLGWRNGVNVGYTVGIHRAKMDAELRQIFDQIDAELKENQDDED